MPRRRLVLLAAVVVVAAAAAPALADNNYGQQQQALDAKLAAVQSKLARARAQESRLNTQIAGLNTQIGTLEARVGDVASRMSALQSDLALRHRRLEALGSLYKVETSRADALRRAYRIAVQRLDARLVDIYESPEPGAIDLALQARSFQDLLDQISYLGLVAAQDRSIAQQVSSARHRVAIARATTAKVRRRVADEENLINARLEQVAIIHNELLTSRSKLADTRTRKSLALTVARTQEQAAIRESSAIEAASADIAAKIRAAQAAAARKASEGTSTDTSATPTTPAPAPGAAGLIWPVTGPITSPFGPRWGGFHPGIDIGVPEGTPIHAAAAGTVIYCGWETGYGNLVVIDHHNGLATAYAHQSKIEASCGQDVSQGQEIGLVGCTGFCTGPHLHFEVRVNGTPVDPLGYLP